MKQEFTKEQWISNINAAWAKFGAREPLDEKTVSWLAEQFSRPIENPCPFGFVDLGVDRIPLSVIYLMAYRFQ
jgi:hypothetical protein